MKISIFLSSEGGGFENILENVSYEIVFNTTIRFFNCQIDLMPRAGLNLQTLAEERNMTVNHFVNITGPYTSFNVDVIKSVIEETYVYTRGKPKFSSITQKANCFMASSFLFILFLRLAFFLFPFLLFFLTFTLFLPRLLIILSSSSSHFFIFATILLLLSVGGW